MSSITYPQFGNRRTEVGNQEVLSDHQPIQCYKNQLSTNLQFELKPLLCRFNMVSNVNYSFKKHKVTSAIEFLVSLIETLELLWPVVLLWELAKRDRRKHLPIIDDRLIDVMK